MPDLMAILKGQILHTNGTMDHMCLTIGTKRQEQEQKGKGTSERDQEVKA